jgi:hypothetical protein
MATNPKPVRKAAGVRTTSARTNSGKKVTIQSSKTYKSGVFTSGSDKPLDKNGKFVKGASMRDAKTLKDTKKLIRKGGVPEGFVGRGKGNQQAGYKEGPSFKKKKGN